LFDVAPEASRPFVVQAGEGLVRAVGTRFNVLLESQTVTVSVLEGRVELEPRAATLPSPTLLGAGQSAAWRQEDGRLVAAAPERASRARIAAWREGKLRFDEWPLERAIEEHNRYAQRPIRLSPEISSQVMVSGVFRIGDTEALIQALGELLQVEAVDTGEAWLLTTAPPR
jgi:transmembrane sensor